MVPAKIFFTKGVGIHKDKLASFELALRKAGIEKFNLVHVSSILPPGCRQVPAEEGLKILQPGQIVFVVMARSDTNEPNRLISAAIGLARPRAQDEYGYLSEHHTFGETAEKSGEYAEDLAATMLATTLGIEFDPDRDWQEREQIYKASGKIFKTTHICQSAQGEKTGKWTTVISVAVFVEENGASPAPVPVPENNQKTK
jgi:arginine decarboxylase